MRSDTLTVRLFASIREQLNVGQLQLPLVRDVDAAIERLSCEYGASWGEVLRAEHVIIAVNQRVADRHALLSAGDELAFYPPVTGG